MTVPIATSPGRSGFGPELSLSHDSGTGNGPFGFGWSLSLQAITRDFDMRISRCTDSSTDEAVADVNLCFLVPKSLCRCSARATSAVGSSAWP